MVKLKEILDITFPWELSSEKQKEASIKAFWKEATNKYNIIFADGRNYVTYDGVRVTLDDDSDNIIGRLFELRKKYVECKFFETYEENIALHNTEWCSKLVGNRPVHN